MHAMPAAATSSAPLPDDQPPVAAIHRDGSSDIDELLAAFAERQRLAGRRVLGLLMSYSDRGVGCQCQMFLRDIDTGEEYLVSQPLGRGSMSCSADPQGFAGASSVLRAALAQRPDLVICNRFGSLEAENGGFAAELLALLAQGTPVLTVVATRHLDAWRRFVGEAPLLPAQPDAWQAWFDAVMARRNVVSEVTGTRPSTATAKP